MGKNVRVFLSRARFDGIQSLAFPGCRLVKKEGTVVVPNALRNKPKITHFHKKPRPGSRPRCRPLQNSDYLWRMFLPLFQTTHLPTIYAVATLGLCAAYVGIIALYRRGWNQTPAWHLPAGFSPDTRVSVLIPARNEA
ncbi:MAG: hypothetical protein D6714_21155, partial [Bacteroidetes bacterium]